MENKSHSLAEAIINYAVETNKQVYEFGTKIAKDYVEFTKGAMALMPGMDAWSQMIPVSVSKKK